LSTEFERFLRVFPNSWKAKKFDHSILPDELAWGEDLAERIGLDMRAAAVDVSRPLEGIYAKWVRE
jgi:hypothetical protein